MSKSGNYNLGEIEKRDAIIHGLADALKSLAGLEVRGHRLIDRLQFSKEGRELSDKINAALDAVEAA